MLAGREGTDADRVVLSLQLNRDIELFGLEVVRRCKWGYPVVIKNFPLLRGVPFPTLYWLTCPHLVRKIGEMEDKLKGKFYVDEQRLLESHYLYASVRFKYFMEVMGDFKVSVPMEFLRVIAFSGVGGVMRDMHRVKCLHSHYAFYLAGYEDPVGELMDSLLVEKECPDNRCEVMLKGNGVTVDGEEL